MLRGYGVMFANFRFGTPVRAPAVAGTFYPRSPETLRQTVGNLLAVAEVRQRSRRCGVIAPHAGYTYSGPVAAEAFAGVRGLCGRIARAAVIGPAHFVPFRGIAAPSDTAFATPLGEVPIDIAMVEALSADALVSANDAPHAPEHAIEVELPFLQAIFGELPIVPLLFGSTSAAAVAEAALAMGQQATFRPVNRSRRRRAMRDGASTIPDRQISGVSPLENSARCGMAMPSALLLQALAR
jgi:AmmeMemoRadiSam system protein B